MNYPEYYQLAWFGYAGVSVALFLLWWWVVHPLNSTLRDSLLLFYAVVAWTPVALDPSSGIWVPAVAVTILGGWMDGQPMFIRGVTPMLFTAFVAVVIMTVKAFIIRAKRE